jgi:hypothetical protein
MAYLATVTSHLETNNLLYFTFFPISQKPIKAIICHLPVNTPAEELSDGLVSLGFDVIGNKQMTTTQLSPSEGTTPLIPHNLTQNAKITTHFKSSKPLSHCNR